MHSNVVSTLAILDATSTNIVQVMGKVRSVGAVSNNGNVRSLDALGLYRKAPRRGAVLFF